ncbi:MAG: hypothetical protein M1830_009999 [Pleopsidium flavum]|nr:MAG: hypothetical protein M1830_009999 [Pleopsidium flavum]
MSCPLSAILNHGDASPQSTTFPHTSDDNMQPETPTSSRNGGAPNNQGGTQSASYGVLPPFELSPSKGNLYNRRANTSPIRIPALPTPPNSDLPVYWFDRDPPTHEMDFNQFNIFTALTHYPELVFELAKYLSPGDLMSLYAISKDFHFIVNGHYTTIVLSQAFSKAPESSGIFLYKCYKNLCITDPAARENAEVPDKFRCVPSFRWLRFICYREKIVDDILTCLASEGHRLPKRASSVLKKIWFTMDLADNARRIGLIHNKEFWTNRDLFVATMFFIKLDMCFTDPVDGNGQMSLRKLLLGQRSLSTLLAALQRTEMLNELGLLQMYVRWKYKPAPAHRAMSIVGVPPAEIGKGHLEGWGLGNKKLLRPDELVMGEGVRRKLDFHKRYMDMMIWGYVDSKTLENIPSTKTVLDDETTESSEEDADMGLAGSEGEMDDEPIGQDEVVIS